MSDRSIISAPAYDAEEANRAHAIEVVRLRVAWEDASRALTDAHQAAIAADFAITQAVDVHRAAYRAYQDALNTAAVTP